MKIETKNFSQIERLRNSGKRAFLKDSSDEQIINYALNCMEMDLKKEV